MTSIRYGFYQSASNSFKCIHVDIEFTLADRVQIVALCVCVHVCVCSCVYLCTCLCRCMYRCVCVWVHMYISCENNGPSPDTAQESKQLSPLLLYSTVYSFRYQSLY